MSNIENTKNLCHNLIMYIIDCLPFSKGLNNESLSYFSAKDFPAGSLIKVSLRNKNIPALVLESRSVLENKTEIKTANFQLKKISSGIAKPFLSKEFLNAIKETSQYFATTQGAVLSEIIPASILENPNLIQNKNTTKKDSGSQKEIFVLQAPDDERIFFYRSLIREEFAQNKSVFICLPQNEEVRQMKEKLERGIEPFVCIFHKEMTKKEFRNEIKKVSETSHPILIIASARWLFLPREDLGTIIIEKENASGWRTLSRPFLDLRFFAENFAKQKKIKLIYSDSFLRVETLYRYKQTEAAEFETVKWRIPKEAETKLVDLRESTKKEFKVLSPELCDLIQKTLNKKENIFIFAARKGISPVTVCRDCGEQVKCSNCDSPMVLYRTKNGGAFKCHQCGETRDAAEICQKCHSWKLAAFGSGVDRVAEEIKKNFPEAKLFEINKDLTSTDNKAKLVAEEFYKNHGAILLGTEMAFPFLQKKVAVSSIVSFDSLFSIPDFRIREKIFGLILRVKSMAKETFLIQTRNLEDVTIEFALNGNLLEFYKNEIEERKILNYPPFGIFIKITARGTKNFIGKEMEKIKEIFARWNPAIFNSTHEKRGEQSAINAVIKLPRVEENLIEKLKSLPPSFEIKVDPDNLL